MTGRFAALALACRTDPRDLPWEERPMVVPDYKLDPDRVHFYHQAFQRSPDVRVAVDDLTVPATLDELVWSETWHRETQVEIVQRELSAGA